jgi:HPt (histidine-containing phosphotransfer) domain-containing protein
MAQPPDSPQPSPSSPELPSIDPERMAMLRELCQDTDPGLLLEMLTSWENDASRHLAEARSALANADPQTLKAAAHAIKGSCSNMGVVRLSEMGRQLEFHCDAPPLAAALLKQMEAEFLRTRGLLAAVTAES